MRFLSSYSHLGNSYSLGRDAKERFFLFVSDCERRNHDVDAQVALNQGLKGRIAMRTVIALLTSLIPISSVRKNLRRRLAYWLFTAGLRRKVRSFGRHSFATGKCSLTKNTVVGDWTCLGGVVAFGGGDFTIGDHVSIGPGLLVQTQNHVYESDSLPYGGGFAHKPVTIGDCVWIGMNVTILPGTRIGEGAIIQMGSVVHGEIPPCAIAGGNPAKVFAWRNKEHYQALKSQNRYLSFG